MWLPVSKETLGVCLLSGQRSKVGRRMGGGGGGEENTDGDVEDVRRRVAEVETTKTGGAADGSAETFVIHDLTLV